MTRLLIFARTPLANIWYMILSGTLILICSTSSSQAGEIWLCDEPKGAALYSSEGREPVADGYTGVYPEVRIGSKEMLIVTSDTAPAGGDPHVWSAPLLRNDEFMATGLVIDDGEIARAIMLYTLDKRRGFLYESTHKNQEILNVSKASSFMAKCQKVH